MHKKRGIMVAIIVMLVVLVMVFMASNQYYHENSQLLIKALKTMRSEPETGFELCGEISIDDYARDCYATYLSVKIEDIRSKYYYYEFAEGEERKDALINMLNEITDEVDRVCSIDLMDEESVACAQMRSVLEIQKDKVLDS